MTYFTKKPPSILIITEGFPRINQPWIDTYLEQLLNHSFYISIYSDNKNPGPYHQKVDRLNLRRYVINFDLKKRSITRILIKATFSGLLNPLIFIKILNNAIRIQRRIIGQYKLNRWSCFLRLIHFGIIDKKIPRVDIIHSHCETLSFEFMFLAQLRNIPLVYTYHGLLPKGVQILTSEKRRFLYNEVSSVLVNTQFAGKQVRAIGCSSNKIKVLPQGLPLEDFDFIPRACPPQKKILRLLSVGRFHREKGFAYALLAVAHLIRNGIHVDYQVVGVGPEKGRLQKIISKLKLSSYVTICEPMNHTQLKKMYQSAHLFILPSIDNRHGYNVETQGVVLQEAQASGCIPIATMVGGIPECLHDRVDAILVRDKSSKAIYDAVCYLLERPDEWSVYQKNGRRNVECNFSAKIIGQRMAKILKDAIQTKG